MHVPVKSLLPRVTLLDVLIAKMVGEEPLTKDDTTALLGHAELIASTFVDQCRVVLKLTAGQHDDDEVRRQTSQLHEVLYENSFYKLFR